MSLFHIDVIDKAASNAITTIVDFRKLVYSDNLNDLNEAEIVYAVGAVKRAALQIANDVKVYRNGTMEFYGVIDVVDYLDGGEVKVHCTGKERSLLSDDVTYANSPWTSTASATIFSDIIGDSSDWSNGTIQAGDTTDFKASPSDKLWDSLLNLLSKTQQDIQFDYANMEIDILDHRGSSTSVAIFNDKKEIDNLRVTETMPLGNKINVYGKGDGINQITATDSDATSIAAYGTIVRTVIDRSIISQTEADLLAAAELALTKDPAEIYDFDVVNPNETISTGDIITLNAPDKDLVDTDARVITKQRGCDLNGHEFLKLSVQNPELKKRIKNRAQVLNDIQKRQKEADTIMQGSGNYLTWPGQINANNTYPLTVEFQVDSRFTDEAGNLRIDSLLLDYDVDPYRKDVGTASFDGSDPQVQNSSANTQPDVLGSAGSNTAGVSGSTAAAGGASVIQDSDTGESGTTIDGGSGVYTTIGSVMSPNSTTTSGIHFFISMSRYGEASQTTWSRMKFRIYRDGSTLCSATVYSKVTQFIFEELTPLYGATCYAHLFVPDNTGPYYYTAAVSRDGGSDTNEDWTASISWYTIGTHTHGDGSLGTDSHPHSDGTLYADNHLHTDGTYDINASDIDNISIGDAVSDAGSLNASQLSQIKLQYWNGSTWTDKHTISNTGKTLDSDVDISNSGAYPDAAGRWRVRILTNHATPDLVKAIVKIRHHLDN